MGKVAIHYYDLGTHRGDEIKQFLKASSGLGAVQVFGFEANPELCSSARRRFRHCDNVQLHNLAVADADDTMVELYLEPRELLGSSIYPDKRNVRTHLTRDVHAVRLSAWIRDAGLIPKPGNVVSVIRANIEGAEWDVISDLHRAGLLSYFDLYLGNKTNWWTDMMKVPSLHAHVPEMKRIMSGAGIVVHRFNGGKAARSERIRPLLRNLVETKSCVS